jgi:hypothetical protein
LTPKLPNQSNERLIADCDELQNIDCCKLSRNHIVGGRDAANTPTGLAAINIDRRRLGYRLPGARWTRGANRGQARQLPTGKLIAAYRRESTKSTGRIMGIFDKAKTEAEDEQQNTGQQNTGQQNTGQQDMGQQQGGGQMGGMETARNMVGQQGGPRDDQGQGMSQGTGMSQGQGGQGMSQGQAAQGQGMSQDQGMGQTGQDQGMGQSGQDQDDQNQGQGMGMSQGQGQGQGQGGQGQGGQGQGQSGQSEQQERGQGW